MLRSKSSIALITTLIILLLLVPVWYMMIAPSIITSELENIDLTTSFEGTLKYFGYGPGVPAFPVRIEAHVYAKEVKGNNIVLGVDAVATNRTDPDKPNTLEEFSYDSTYVFNKVTLENVEDAPEADKERTGYDPLLPSNIKSGEPITNVWFDNLNTTGTLEYVTSKKEEGLTLYMYSGNETVDGTFWIEDFGDWRNLTLTSTKTIWVEPLSGLQAYTESETLTVDVHYKQQEPLTLVDLQYESTAKARNDGIADAKAAYDGLQLLGIYIPSILGVSVVILAAGFALNLRRLRRKTLGSQP